MRIDPHSYTDDSQPVVRELEWKAKLDFTRKVIQAEAVLIFEAAGTGPLDLDTRDLKILAVESMGGKGVPYELGQAEPILGSRLRVKLPEAVKSIRLRYETSPDASALQWLTPAQTAGGRLPFLFSQCQAIHARAVVPIQDTPRHRIRYSAELTLPKELKALMAAAFVSRIEKDGVAVEQFEMPQTIPPYLFALAAGELTSSELGPRCRVWAEPGTLKRAVYEFADAEKMLQTAEKLFGPYDWERFDFLVLPPSFPYGGMENPRLTFLTPTLLAGDRSLVDVLAHELAHSWAGNLVTNATAEHFWLNEGLTVYAERRILEALHNPDVAAISAANGWQSLEHAIHEFREKPSLTRLRTRLEGIDPDAAYSVVPYEKGYLFFLALERELGRERFDPFLKRYLARFRFKSITTEEFSTFMEFENPGLLRKIDSRSYFDEGGIPPRALRPHSKRLDAIEKLGQGMPEAKVARAWRASEWQVWLHGLRGKVTAGQCAEIDRSFQLSESGNYEILVSWLEAALAAEYAPAIVRAEKVLCEVGRMKYLKPLYKALAKKDRANARKVFERCRPGYHPIAVQAIEGVLGPRDGAAGT